MERNVHDARERRYTLDLTSLGASRLCWDDELLIDVHAGQEVRRGVARLALEEGRRHAVRVDYTPPAHA